MVGEVEDALHRRGVHVLRIVHGDEHRVLPRQFEDELEEVLRDVEGADLRRFVTEDRPLPGCQAQQRGRPGRGHPHGPDERADTTEGSIALTACPRHAEDHRAVRGASVGERPQQFRLAACDHTVDQGYPPLALGRLREQPF